MGRRQNEGVSGYVRPLCLVSKFGELQGRGDSHQRIANRKVRNPSAPIECKGPDVLPVLPIGKV